LGDILLKSLFLLLTKKTPNNKAIVKLLIAFNDTQTPFKITLKMIHSDRWRVYDLVFSGVSLIKNYRAQFNSHIKRKGLDSLIKKINNKLQNKLSTHAH
jgi:phospholipid transport system substrate-binding protein